MLSLPRTWVQSLVRELRSHEPCSTAKKRYLKTKNTITERKSPKEDQEENIEDKEDEETESRGKI